MRTEFCMICGAELTKGNAFCPCCGKKQLTGSRKVFPVNDLTAQILNDWLFEHPQLAEVSILSADGGAEVIYEQLACDNRYRYQLFSTDAPEAKFAKQTLAGVSGLENFVLCRMERRSASNL